MIRRPSRTALHSALSALAGGFRGMAMQREKEEQRKQLGMENERASLRTALDLAEVGAEVAPEPAPGTMPAGPAQPTVSFGGQRYRVPSVADRARIRAEAEAKVAGATRDRENRGSFGALRMVAPIVSPGLDVGEYDENVNYADVLGELSPYRISTPTTSTATPRPMTAAQQAAEAAKARMGDGYMVEFGNAASTKYNADEAARFWNAFDFIRKQNPGVSDGRVAYDAFQTLRTGSMQASTRTPDEPLPGRTGLRSGTAPPPPPPGAGGATPTPAAPPARPVQTTPPATPATTTPPATPIPPQPSWFKESDIGMSWAQFYRESMSGRKP